MFPLWIGVQVAESAPHALTCSEPSQASTFVSAVEQTRNPFGRPEQLSQFIINTLFSALVGSVYPRQPQLQRGTAIRKEDDDTDGELFLTGRATRTICLLSLCCWARSLNTMYDNGGPFSMLHEIAWAVSLQYFMEDMEMYMYILPRLVRLWLLLFSQLAMIPF